MSSPGNPPSSPREFYSAALAESFRHSAMLATQTGRRAEQIVDTPEFEALLGDSRASSLELARRIGDMAVVYLSAGAAPWPWWKELLAYERAYFLQAVSAEQRLVTYFPRRGVAATTVHFTWDLPLLLERIRASSEKMGIADSPEPGVLHPLHHEAEQRMGGAEPDPPLVDIPRHDLTLLFSRAPDGKTYVIELEKPLSAVFRFTNGMRKKEQIAEAADMPLAEVEDILRALSEIGAVENV